MINNKKLPIFMGGSLTYYPHPLNKQIDIAPTNNITSTIYVGVRNLARLQQISEHTKRRLIKFDPDIAIILARGGVPLNFSIINRFMKETHGKNHSKFLNGKVFHLFPGLERIWQGMESIPELKSFCTDQEKAREFFLLEMSNFINTHFKTSNIIKIFYLDNTNSGRTLIQTLNVLKTLAIRTNKRVVLSMHGVLNVKANPNKSGIEIKGPKQNKVKVLLPSGCKNIPAKGHQFDNVEIYSWHYYPVENLFIEDMSDFLAADILNGYLVNHNVFRNVIFCSDAGDEVSGSTSRNTAAQDLIMKLAEWGPTAISRKQHMKEAKYPKRKNPPPLPMEKILEYMDPKK